MKARQADLHLALRKHVYKHMRNSMLMLAFAMPGAAQAAPAIAVTIKPLQLIAAAVSEGVTEPAVVWSQGQDPHHVSLRPSERRLLADADLVLWIGPMLEHPLEELVGELEAEIVTVQDIDDLVLLTVDGQPDPHVWVDTRNARAIATKLAMHLTTLDASNAARYADNLRQFERELDTLDTEMQQDFAALQQREWAVYHHALRYLERELGLLPPVMLADSENNAPGLRTAVQVRAQLQEKQITCMLAEPGVDHARVVTMLDLPALELVDADVMGTGAQTGDYVGYMRTLAATLRDCLGAAR